MADRLVPQSYTFEQWRVEFNELATDFGDFTTLDAELVGFGGSDMLGLTKSEKALAIAIAFS